MVVLFDLWACGLVFVGIISDNCFWAGFGVGFGFLDLVVWGLCSWRVGVGVGCLTMLLLIICVSWRLDVACLFVGDSFGFLFGAFTAL